MPKRARSPSTEPSTSLQHPPKRLQPLSSGPPLSDELYVHIFQHLPKSDLISCQLVCRRFYRIAGDNQIWRDTFYDDFIQPRFRWQTTITTADKQPDEATRKKKKQMRLEQWRDAEVIDDCGAKDWKGLYKLRHNWLSGCCNVSERRIYHEVDSSILVGLKDVSPPSSLFCYLKHIRQNISSY